jgi:glycerate 2-kinase
MPRDPRLFLQSLFDAAILAAKPSARLAGFLPAPPKGRTIVVGGGKAAAAMAAALEELWPGPLAGLVVTRYGHRAPTRRIEVVEAAHPVPDAAGQAAARRMLAMVRNLTRDDLVLCLMSGGASALLALPADGITLADKQSLSTALLKSGADIGEMNTVRKHLSQIKGGRLAAAAYPARVVTLAISDVPGDLATVIGSGPTVADPTSFADARAILAKYRITPPAGIAAHLAAAHEETPKPGDPRLRTASFELIASPQIALTAAANLARAAGVMPVVLGDSIEGEAREVARVFAGIARQVRRHNQPAAAPCVLLSGGETTVTVRGSGRGGRNLEFLLALAVALEAEPGIAAIAGDTDGIDGTQENAGAVLLPDSLARAAEKKVDAKASLAENDGYGFFAALGDLVVTGPTLTNVNDFRAILIEAI